METAAAPYADKPIQVSLSSITGFKYRTYNCVECGNPILERSTDTIFRFNDDAPEIAHTDIDGVIPTVCNNCKQKYAFIITVSNIENSAINLPLFMQPQSLFVVVEPNKKLRNLHCMECGHSFHSVSDRIGMLVDNVIPFEMLDPAKLGPMEAHCRFNRCKQRWWVM